VRQAASVDARDSKRSSEQAVVKALSPADQRRVKELAQVDQRVRAHEAAHQAAAGSAGGSVSFSYETGPDGKSYAVGGEVPVDLSSGRTPEETIAKAQQVRAAALAPADPSPQDLAVASEASQIEAGARAQLIQQQLAVQRGDSDTTIPVIGASSAATGEAQQVRPAGAGGGAKAKPAAAKASVSASNDVGGQALATVSALQAERSLSGASQAQVQHIARLAASAYHRM
jgi:hypothetical protein